MLAHRNITYRLIPGSRARASAVARTAGACRFTWNRVLADTQPDERICEDTLIGLCFERPPKPSLTFFTSRS